MISVPTPSLGQFRLRAGGRYRLLAVATLAATMVACAPALAQDRGRGPTESGALARDAAGAAAILRSYFGAITAHDYPRAYALWANGGAASGKSLKAFAEGFAHTRLAYVAVTAVEPPEGAAGTVSVSIAVEIRATMDDGARQYFAGSYRLRRIDGVPGATPAQLAWHIASATLHQTN